MCASGGVEVWRPHALLVVIFSGRLLFGIISGVQLFVRVTSDGRMMTRECSRIIPAYTKGQPYVLHKDADHSRELGSQSGVRAAELESKLRAGRSREGQKERENDDVRGDVTKREEEIIRDRCYYEGVFQGLL